MALLGEMRRRNIFKVSLAYAIISWLIVQIADIILPTFAAPEWIMQVLVVMLILLFGRTLYQIADLALPGRFRGA